MPVYTRRLVIILVIALGGLLLVQWYWIKNSYMLVERQFDSQVHTILESTIKNMYRIEARAFMSKMDTVERKFLTGYGIDTASVEKIRHIDVRREGNAKLLRFRTDSGMVWQSTPADTQVSNRTYIIKLVMDELNREREQSLDTLLLDSLFRSALQQGGINLKYEFAIRGRDKSLVYKSDQSIDDAVFENMGYSQSLFLSPRRNQSVIMYFPRERSYLIGKILLTIFLTVLFSAVIIWCFWYTMEIIRKQKKLSDIKNDFISNLTHEFKTPVSTIRLATEYLSETDLSQNQDKVNQYLNLIKNENMRLGNQITRVLELAQHDLGEIKLKLEEVDFSRLIRECCKTYHLNQKIKLTVDLPDDPVLCKGDPDQLTNAILNILDNAVKYSDATPVIQVELQKKDNEVVLSIADKGRGIPENELSSIFDKFYRVSQGYRHDVKGFGIGLYFTKMIVEMHGGTIHVQSRLSKGSVFKIKLPCHA